MADTDGWSGLFSAAFERSRNAMLLTDDRREIVAANPSFLVLIGRRREDVVGRHLWEFVAHGPLRTPEEWSMSLAAGRFSGEATLVSADGTSATVQWAASTETVTGSRLVLFVVVGASRWGGHFRRDSPARAPSAKPLTPREREIVHLVALGAAGPEIADDLQISHETVRTHVRNAMGKVGARSRAHLVAKALGEGLTAP